MKQPDIFTNFESLRKGIIHSYDGVPRDDEWAPLTALMTDISPELDGTFIANPDGWMDFIDISFMPKTVEPFLGGFVCSTILG